MLFLSICCEVALATLWWKYNDFSLRQQNCTISPSNSLSYTGLRRKHGLTLIAIPDGVKVHVVLVISEEEEAEPRVKGVDRNDEEDSHDVALLPRWAVET